MEGQAPARLHTGDTVIVGDISYQHTEGELIIKERGKLIDPRTDIWAEHAAWYFEYLCLTPSNLKKRSQSTC